MKRVFTTLITAVLFCVACNGESPTATMTIEILEFDCTAHPDLFDKYASFHKPKTDSETAGFNFDNSLSRQDEVLKEVEQVATKTILLNHSQEIVIGDSVNQTTQSEDFKFDLKALTSTTDNGSIGIDLDISLKIGKYKKRGINTEITVQRGQAVSLGGFTSTKTTQHENGVEKVVKTLSVIRVKVEKSITELSDEMFMLLKRYEIDISIREQVMSPEGRLVLAVNENVSFSDGATIVIYPEWFDDLGQVARRIKMTINIAKDNAKKRFSTMTIPEGNNVPVTFE